MHSATPEPAASKSSLSMPPGASGWSFVTTVAGSILKRCMPDARHIRGSRVCANGRKESAPDSQFGAAPRPEQKSCCPSLIPSPSNRMVDKLEFREAFPKLLRHEAALRFEK